MSEGALERSLRSLQLRNERIATSQRERSYSSGAKGLRRAGSAALGAYAAAANASSSFSASSIEASFNTLSSVQPPRTAHSPTSRLHNAAYGPTPAAATAVCAGCAQWSREYAALHAQLEARCAADQAEADAQQQLRAEVEALRARIVQLCDTSADAARSLITLGKLDAISHRLTRARDDECAGRVELMQNEALARSDLWAAMLRAATRIVAQISATAAAPKRHAQRTTQRRTDDANESMFWAVDDTVGPFRTAAAAAPTRSTTHRLNVVPADAVAARGFDPVEVADTLLLRHSNLGDATTVAAPATVKGRLSQRVADLRRSLAQTSASAHP